MCNIRESTEMNCQNIWYGNAPISECVGIFFVGFYNTYRIMYGLHPANQRSHKRMSNTLCDDTNEKHNN